MVAAKVEIAEAVNEETIAEAVAVSTEADLAVADSVVETISVHVRCTKQFVQIAEQNVKFLSNLQKENL